MSISAVLVVKNEEKNLERALKSLTFVDEIVLVDMQSSDRTLEVAKKYHCKIFAAPKDTGYVEPARNFSLSKAKGDWLLVLDADEEIGSQLAKTILNTIEQARADVYFIARANIIFNQVIEHSGWWPDYQARLFRKGKLKWSEAIHVPPSITGRIEHFPANQDLAIIHHNYDTIEDFVLRSNRYTSVAAQQELNKKITSQNLFNTFSHEFFKRFFFDEGIKDGTHGMALALLQANYEVLIRLKQWQKMNFVDKKDQEKQSIATLKQFKKDLSYWLADLELKNASGPKKLCLKIKRKLKF